MGFVVCKSCQKITGFVRGDLCGDCKKLEITLDRKMRRRTNAREEARTKKLAEYGISLEEYERMKFIQGGRCAICKRKDAIRLAVDHNHATGQVRGLLCRNCNLGLGLFGDDKALLKSAADYLGN